MTLVENTQEFIDFIGIFLVFYWYYFIDFIGTWNVSFWAQFTDSLHAGLKWPDEGPSRERSFSMMKDFRQSSEAVG